MRVRVRIEWWFAYDLRVSSPDSWIEGSFDKDVEIEFTKVGLELSPLSRRHSDIVLFLSVSSANRIRSD